MEERVVMFTSNYNADFEQTFKMTWKKKKKCEFSTVCDLLHLMKTLIIKLL